MSGYSDHSGNGGTEDSASERRTMSAVIHIPAGSMPVVLPETERCSSKIMVDRFRVIMMNHLYAVASSEHASSSAMNLDMQNRPSEP